MRISNRDVGSIDLDQLRRNLTRYGMQERTPDHWPVRRRLLLKTVNAVMPLADGIGRGGKSARDLGTDWPAEAETMIGMQRLTSLVNGQVDVPAGGQVKVATLCGSSGCG